MDVLHEFSSCIQVASIDESYLDITEAVEERMQQISEMENGVCLEKLPSTFVIGYSDDKSNDEGIFLTFFCIASLFLCLQGSMQISD